MTRLRWQAWAPWCALAGIACDASTYRPYTPGAAAKPHPAPPPGHASALVDLAASATVVASAVPRATPEAPLATQHQQLYLQAASFAAHGRTMDASGLLKRCIVLAPAYANGYRALGSAYSERGTPDIAVAYYEKYLRLVPGAVDVPVVRQMIQSVLQASEALE